MGSVFSEPASCPIPRTPKKEEAKKKRLTNMRKNDCKVNNAKCSDHGAAEPPPIILTWTIPNVAEVTGSEKSPPGGDTLRGSGYWREKSARTIDNVPYMPINNTNCKANYEG